MINNPIEIQEISSAVQTQSVIGKMASKVYITSYYMVYNAYLMVVNLSIGHRGNTGVYHGLVPEDQRYQIEGLTVREDGARNMC